MAGIEAICARLCLLTRAAWREELPAPLTRPMVRRMVRLGALSGLTLRRIPQIRADHYARAEALLLRSKQMYREVEAMYARGYSVLLPEDALWPVNLNALGTQMPQFLFVRGNRAWLRRRAVAVAGSRRIGPQTVTAAEGCGEWLAREEYAMVCGGATGVDTACQRAFLRQAGGGLILVPALPAGQLQQQAYLRAAMDDGRLLMLCDTWPDEPFSAVKAIMRNHTIYALGDAAVVIAARCGKGGTWNGAMDCLHGGYTPVYAADEQGVDFEGNRLLLEYGAKPVNLRRPMGEQLFPAKEDQACR